LFLALLIWIKLRTQQKFHFGLKEKGACYHTLYGYGLMYGLTAVTTHNTEKIS
ncbi:hypothetical protein ACJX0J_027477, partial [Zea mays]